MATAVAAAAQNGGYRVLRGGQAVTVGDEPNPGQDH